MMASLLFAQKLKVSVINAEIKKLIHYVKSVEVIALMIQNI